MDPITPVFPGRDAPVTTFAKDQPEYRALPAYRSPSGLVVTRWRLTWKERFRIFWTGDLWCSFLTHNHPLQPTLLGVRPPELEEKR